MTKNNIEILSEPFHTVHSDPGNLQVLYEDNHLLIVNKRAGDIVQGDKTGDRPLSEVARAYIKEKYHKPGEVFLGVTHRLDRPTSGVLAFARTSKALARMNSLFAEKETRKVYWAVVKDRPEQESGQLTHWLTRNSKQNKSYAHTRAVTGAKQAVLDYRLIRELDNYYLLEILLKTGRHHQIRAQLSAIGSPIKGDLKYGAARSNADGSIHLHARELTFIHPVRKEVLSCIAPPPADSLWEACL